MISIIPIWTTYVMPHLVTSRERVSDNKTSLFNLSWTVFSAWIYKIGGILFVLGSVLFFPAFSHYQDIGVWLFIIGSILYLVVTGHDLLETQAYWRLHPTHSKADIIEKVANINYVFGSVLFTVGSFCFLSQIDSAILGSWCFIIGSILFVIGGCANLLQLPSAPSFTYLQLFNFTLVTFIVGSALFIFATIPYLQHYKMPIDQTQIDNLSALMFTIGSLLFWLGGVMIFWRQSLQNKLSDQTHPSRFGHNFILAIQQEIVSEQQGNNK